MYDFTIRCDSYDTHIVLYDSWAFMIRWYDTKLFTHDTICTILTTMAITHFLFIYKSASFLFYFLETNMKCWQMEKYKTSAKLGFWEPNLAIVLEVGRPKLYFRRCRLFKKIEWVLFLPIVGVFWKKEN